jgi:dethiobiotin synthetase
VPGLFVAGTGTDVGKTYVTATIIQALVANGRTVEALKPVVSGFDPAAPEASDPAVLLAALGRAATAEALAEVSPWRFREPLSPPIAARREGKVIDADEVTALCRERVRQAQDRLLVVESAGGIMSPLSEKTTMLDLAAALKLPIVLVAGSYLGTVSHTLTALAAMAARRVTPLAVVVSESEGAPPLHETADALRAFITDAPVLVMPRSSGAPIQLLVLL